MTKHCWFLSLLLVVAVALTGCGLSAKADETPLQPLNAATWPTPKPTALPASPTPFPHGQPVAATATIAPPIATVAATLVATTAVTAPTTTKGAAAVNYNLNNPVAAAFVAADNAVVVRQPGQTAGAAIPKGELVAVLGQNASGDWLYVLTTTQARGWLPKNSLRVTGTLAQAPVLPADPLAAVAQAAATTPAVATVAPTATPDLKPVAAALVNSDGLNRRQGPGAAYPKLDVLSRETKVSVLAVNPTRDWALVKTADGQQGWVYLAHLTVQGDVSGAPALKTVNAASSPATPIATAAAEIGGLGVATTAHIARDEVYIHPGPGVEFAAIDQLTDPQTRLTVLALDQSGQWALLQAAGAKTGWVALNDLAVDGSLSAAPKIYTAWVVSNAIEVRRGPGIFTEPTGQLAINSLVRVLGLDESGSWALIQPIPAGSLGWAQIQFLKNVGRPWASVPVVKDKSETLRVQAEVEPTPNSQLSTLNAQPHLVFQRASGGDIMVINPDGSGLHRLTSGIDPALSPDGQTVALTRWQGETGSLWVINLDGSNERQVLGDIKQAKGVDWSPDGAQLVLNYQHGGRLEAKPQCLDVSKGQRRVPPRNASGIKVKVDNGSPSLCWTLPPDPQWGLRVVNLADGSFKDVDGGTYAFRPAWDPAQPWRIVSDGGRGLLAVDLNRNDRQNLTAEVNDGSPVFSPDGRYLVVSVGPDGGGAGHDLYRLNADGSGRVQLTQTPLWVTVQPDEAKAWNNVAPVFSPDGAQIAFVTDRAGRWEIWVMNADGSNPHPLFSAEVNAQLQLTYNFVDEHVLSWK